MNSRNSLLNLCLLTLTSVAPAFSATWSTHFLPGRETCAKYANLTGDELGRFIEVPIDYANPERGTTSIYFWTKETLDPEKPVILFLAGGPGATSHDNEFQPLSSQANVVYLDQRGVSCSKAPTLALHRDPSFYSSENTARDVDRVREALGVERLSVYGHSYGTVPATIYASFFPQHTRALILEGTVFSGGRNLYQDESVRRLVQEHFDGLRPEMKDAILRLSKDPRLSPSWYSRVNQFMMYLDDPFALLDGFLESSLFTEGMEPTSVLSGFSESSKSEDEFGFGLVTFAMLSCQELGLGEPDATFFSVFDADGRLVSDGDASPQNQLCRELTVASSHPYFSERYPVRVPVTYFQGEYDGATALSGALKHFKLVPQRTAQFLMLERGGHLPNQSFLAESQDASSAQLAIFLQAARGEKISQNLLDRFNEVNALKWRISSR